MTRFFFFGTLLDLDVLSIVLDRPVGPTDLAPARLQGFARRRVLTDSFPMLVEDPNGHVDGAVFTARDQTDHDRVLFFEDFDYDLEPCRPVLESGEEVEALYCGAEPQTAAADALWSLAEWSKAHKAPFLEISHIYMACFGKMTAEEAEPVWQEARRRLDPASLPSENDQTESVRQGRLTA